MTDRSSDGRNRCHPYFEDDEKTLRSITPVTWASGDQAEEEAFFKKLEQEQRRIHIRKRRYIAVFVVMAVLCIISIFLKR